MTKRCTVCPHDDRKAIDRAILAGHSARAIGVQYGFLPGAIWRHRVHVETQLVHAHRALEATNGSDLARSVAELKERADRLGAQAESSGDLRTALLAVRELTRLTELMARLSLEARAGIAADVAMHPIWKAVAADTVAALTPYPDALASVKLAWEKRLGRETAS